MKSIGTVLAIVFLVLFPGIDVQAQPTDGVAESLGLGPDRNALPIWTNASGSAKRELGKFVRSSHQIVMIIGNRTGYGTGFVISKKHRLVATNAHVADIAQRAGKFVAVTNGTAQAYPVEKSWYHPGLKRYLRGQPSLVIRSEDPKDGPVYPRSPDLAVLQLGSAGPELPQQVTFASAREVDAMFAQPVGILGFPSHDYNAWPAVGSEASATYHDGVVSRLTDFNLNGGGPASKRQFVQYTLATWSGFSGSPVFLANGRVVAIHNMARYDQGAGGDIKSIAHGIRVDCLWELLVHHKLDDKVSIPVERSSLDIARWLKPDETAEKFRRAIVLAAKADQLIAQKKYSEGIRLANEATELAPSFPEPYFIRSTGYINYVFDNHRQIAKSTSIEQLGFARSQIRKYIRLAPTDPEGITQLATVLNNTSYLTKDRNQMRTALSLADRLLRSDNISNALRAKAHSVRAVSYSNLREDATALAEHNEALRLDPKNPSLWETRADYWRNLGRTSLYQSDMRRAQQLRGQ